MNSTYRALLANRGFFCFLVTLFLGAMNDNIYRLVVSFILVDDAITGSLVSVAAIIFMLPGIMFAGYAGYLADRFSKRKVLIVTKAFEILAMLFAFFALKSHDKSLMYAVLFCMAAQSVFFSPAKYGIVPETVGREALSKANGLLEMATYMGIIVGSALAGLLLTLFKRDTTVISLILIVVAVLGVIFSFGISKVNPRAPNRPLRWNPYAEIIAGVKLLKNQRFLTMVVMGISYFWMLAMVLQVNLLVYGTQVLQLSHVGVSILLLVLGLGIGVGSLLAGRWSEDRIEYGLIPLGLLGTGVGIFLLAVLTPSIIRTYVLLTVAAVFTGLYIVPLNALLQDIPDKRHKGRMIATNNFFADFFMITGACSLWFMQAVLHLNANTIFLILGVITLIVTAGVIYQIPDVFVRLLLWMMTHSLYRVKVINEHFVPKRGAALLICNHVSFIDALILSAVVPRFIRYMIHADYYDIKALNWLFRLARCIPIEAGAKNKVLASLNLARQEMENGHMLCFFAEGRISRTGNLLPFRRGFERIMENSDAPIIPVYLGKLWDSIFSFRGGRFFWKLPRRVPVEVSVTFGAPMPPNSTAEQVRQRVQELGAESQLRSQSYDDIMGLRLLESTRLRSFEFCMADQSGDSFTYGEILGRMLILARRIKAEFPDEKRVGVLMPPCVNAALINMALVLAGKTAVNIPYGRRREDPTHFMTMTGVKRVITGREWLHSLNIEPFEGTFYFEDWNWFNQHQYLHARLALLALPAKALLRMYGETRTNPSDPVAILWSLNLEKSGKPVVLSHQSIIYPVNSFMQVFDDITSEDRVVATVPMFTTMGLLCDLWLPLLNGMGIAFHHNARDKITEIGALIKQYKATIIFDMPQVFRAIFEQLPPEAFSYIRFAIMGGESVTLEFLEQFEAYFGAKIYEGYGNTETGPVTMNVPDVRSPGHLQRGTKLGSFGQPLPYVSVKIVDPSTFEEMPTGQRGTLLVKTPFRMLGYLNDPDATHAVFHEDWYITGDEASVDQEGFVFFTELQHMI